MRKIRKINGTQWVQLGFLSLLWVLIVGIRANVAAVFSSGWYIGIAVGFLLTLHIGWRARGYAEGQDH